MSRHERTRAFAGLRRREIRIGLRFATRGVRGRPGGVPPKPRQCE